MALICGGGSSATTISLDGVSINGKSAMRFAADSPEDVFGYGAGMGWG